MKKVRLSFYVIFFILTLCCTASAESKFFVDNYFSKINITGEKKYHYLNKTDFNFYTNQKDAQFLITGRGDPKNYKIDDIYVKDALFSVVKEEKGDTVTFSPKEGDFSGKNRITSSYTITCTKDTDNSADYAVLTIVEPWEKVSVSNAYVIITLPTDKIEGVELKSEKDNKNINFVTEGNTITVTACDILPSDSIYATIKLPEGTFKNAKSHIISKGTEYTIVNILIVAAAILFIAMLFAKFGLHAGILPAGEMYPPENLSPIEVEYAYTKKIRDKTCGSMIVYWASKGYLKIIQDSVSDYTLIKLKEIDKSEPDYIISAYTQLWKNGKDNTVKGTDLENKYYITAERMKAGAASSFIKDKIFENSRGEKYSDYSNIILISAGILIIILTSLINLLGFSSAAISVILFALSGLVLYRFIKFASKKIYKSAYIITIIACSSAASLGISVLLTKFINTSGIISSPAITVPLWILLSLQSLAALITKKTDYTLLLMENINRFKHFIKNPSPDKIREAVKTDEEYLFNILPYAVVFDCEKEWINCIKKIKIKPFSNYVCNCEPGINELDKAKYLVNLIKLIGEKSFSYRRVKDNRNS